MFIYRSDEALPAFEASMPGTVRSIYAPPLDERWGPSLNSPEQKVVYTNTEDWNLSMVYLFLFMKPEF